MNDNVFRLELWNAAVILSPESKDGLRGTLPTKIRRLGLPGGAADDAPAALVGHAAAGGAGAWRLGDGLERCSVSARGCAAAPWFSPFGSVTATGAGSETTTGCGSARGTGLDSKTLGAEFSMETLDSSGASSPHGGGASAITTAMFNAAKGARQPSIHH
ncbi:UNVERIFIED_CONTAM: hypothetical protein Sradi_3620300 [Sesamum radiatum]|uniref:Uncharacterized protein n=1 Tax=Sesamum radiatum TaxID=300843 RepID=A0AAW2QHC0_SESRA